MTLFQLLGLLGIGIVAAAYIPRIRHHKRHSLIFWDAFTGVQEQTLTSKQPET
jgi:hypothetical protein